MADTPNNTPGFEFKFADGNVVKAENVEEAFKTVAKMKEDTTAALKAERTHREEIEAQVNALRAEVAQRNQPPPPAEGQFNRDHYFRLVGEDPVAAANYLDAARYGIADPQQVPGYFQDTFQKVTRLEYSTLAADFTNAHPEFPGGLDNSQTLTKEVIRLHQAGHPVSMETMDLAWRNCVDNDQIKPLEPPQEPEEPNPSLGGSGAGTVDAEASRIEADLNSGKMSMTEFEKYLRSKGALQ
jgi:hypothetical protein